MTVRMYVCTMAALTCGSVAPLVAQQPTADTTPAVTPRGDKTDCPEQRRASAAQNAPRGGVFDRQRNGGFHYGES